ncbi:hypothetical protein EUX98_g3529 [Antrodiella citrinella]|uniref:Uncharacterized protein n=1 Tax=Antrodiella citrinella TaxID=2447956 RepID=A0A4S4MXF9_9APHY|nr:hypothetical protein EUX98_g3529 [Antrodiella citrinella]
MADHSHMITTYAKPIHFALRNRITNNANPSAPPYKRSDGRVGKLVIVDDRGEVQFPWGVALNIMDWCPLAQTGTVAGKLQRRIMRTGYVLPVNAAIAGALLSEIYTTTSAAGSNDPRLRLKYRSSPIADFGICHGAVSVAPSDRLLFYSLGRQKIVDGQDPDNHYWLYFTSLKGEEVYLDCCMHPFNLAQLIRTVGYPPPQLEVTNIGVSPCHWTERQLLKRNLSIYTERSRMSFLHNSTLQEVMKRSVDRWSERDMSAFYGAVESLSEKPFPTPEKELLGKMLRLHCKNLGTVFETEQWKRYPRDPDIAFELDPGQKIAGLNEKTHPSTLFISETRTA